MQTGKEINRLKPSLQMKIKARAQMPSEELALRGVYATLCRQAVGRGLGVTEPGFEYSLCQLPAV